MTDEKRLDDTPTEWKRRIREEIQMMLARNPQETNNKGRGVLIDELLEEE